MGKKQKITEPIVTEDDSFDPMEFAAISDYQTELKQAVREARGTFTNNTEGLLQKLEEIALPRDWPWVESLTITTQKPVEVDDINDDLKRESIFYQSALGAAKQALLQLEHSGVPYKRPEDFYAESVKPDAHMAKIKQILLNEKKRIDDVEERKKQRELKKYAKSVKSDRLKERAKQKRDALDEIDRFKTKSKHNDASSASFKASIGKRGREDRDGEAPAKRSRTDRDAPPTKRPDFSKPKSDSKNPRRAAKDSRYGHGGKKRDVKRNTSESSRDVSGFNSKKNRTPFKGRA